MSASFVTVLRARQKACPCLVLFFLLANGNQLAGREPQQPKSERCVRALPNDPEPWVSNARVLASFPPDERRPEWLGGFADRGSEYELHLWRDAGGIFGQLLHPLMESDSPASRLYDVRMDASTRRLSFVARFADGSRNFSGKLSATAVTGTLRHDRGSERVSWRKIPARSLHGVTEDAYTSRDQFECAMTLFHRN